MPRNDDSADQGKDLEVMVGNKLLLSMLFLVMVLLGVFFGMGYLAGKGTGGEVKTVEAAGAAKTANPLPFKGSSTPASEKSTEPGTADPAPPDPPVVKEARKEMMESLPPAAMEKPQAAPPPAASLDLPAPPPGKYLQASALPRKQAEVLSREFRKSGLPSQIALSPRKPKPGAEPLYRVLVGPLADNVAVSEARMRLKDKGINQPIPVAY